MIHPQLVTGQLHDMEFGVWSDTVDAISTPVYTECVVMGNRIGWPTAHTMLLWAEIQRP